MAAILDIANQLAPAGVVSTNTDLVVTPHPAVIDAPPVRLPSPP